MRKRDEQLCFAMFACEPSAEAIFPGMIHVQIVLRLVPMMMLQVVLPWVLKRKHIRLHTLYQRLKSGASNASP